MRRKILMGAFALALPAGTMAVTSSAAFAKKPPPNPINCSGFSPVLIFGSPLSVNGVTTPLKKGGPPTTVGASTFSCTGGTNNATSPALTIATGKNTKVSKGVYQTGTWAEFTSTGGSIKKSLKNITFTINGSPEGFKTKSSSIQVGGLCGGDVGFLLSGQVNAPPYNTKSADVLACLGTDTHVDTTHGTFLGDYLVYNGVVSAQIDPAVSNAVL